MRMMLLLLLGTSLAWGQEDPEEMAARATKMFTSMIKADRLKQALDLVSDDFAVTLSDHPSELGNIAAAGSDHASKLAQGDPESWKRFVKFLETALKGIPEDSRGTPAVESATLETTVCKLRVDAATGEAFEKAQWLAAADGFVKLSGKDPEGGKHLTRAAKLLSEGARIGGEEEGSDLQAKSLELLIEGAKKFPNNKYFAAGRYRAQLAMIEKTYNKNKAHGKKMLKEYFEALSGPSRDGAARDSAYNDAVTFARTHSGLGKPKYRTEKIDSTYVSMEIPISSRWKKKGRSIEQYDATGELIRRISFDEYKWTTLYYIGTKEFGGDNLKGIARIGEVAVLKVVKDVTLRRKVRRGKLSRRISAAITFTIGGHGEDGKYVCFRQYYYKSKKKKMRTIEVTITEWVVSKKLDPETAHVVSTMRE